MLFLLSQANGELLGYPLISSLNGPGVLDDWPDLLVGADQPHMMMMMMMTKEEDEQLPAKLHFLQALEV